MSTENEKNIARNQQKKMKVEHTRIHVLILSLALTLIEEDENKKQQKIAKVLMKRSDSNHCKTDMCDGLSPYVKAF